MSGLRIVVANRSLAAYPEGGGLWAWLLQYMMGLNALGHDAFWLELLRSRGDSHHDEPRIATFFRRFEEYGLGGRCILLVCNEHLGEVDLASARVYGASKRQVEEICRDADLLWNFSCALRQPLLSRFRRRVLIGTDPGHLQISALTWDLGIHDHHVHLTDGLRLNAPDCGVPTLGLKWHPFPPAIYLPLWSETPDPGPGAPFTSVTQWWSSEELWFEGRVLSLSKRDGFLPYLELPHRTRRRLQLAVNLHPDERKERASLRRHGWELADPHVVAGSIGAFQGYIRDSRAEFGCAKPVYTDLRTGWFSERSACYLASGRPVVVEDTGFSDVLPTGEGILPFTTLEEAVAAVHEVDANYQRHADAARSIAREYFDSKKVLSRMIDVAFGSDASPPPPAGPSRSSSGS